MKILFVNLSALKFTAATPDVAPLGGSESALCYLARSLAKRGHDVSIIANLSDALIGTCVENIEHYPITILKDRAFFAAEKFEAIIICNAPAACVPIKSLSPASRLFFWAHALPDQPAMQVLAQTETQTSIDTTIFVSDWQRREIDRAFGTFQKVAVIGNGIAPAFENMFASPDELLQAKQNRAAYTTTPYRGLSVLLRAMQGVGRSTHLELFSSMHVYQAADDDYADLFDEASKNQAIKSHGSVTQRELSGHLRSCAFLFYPCIYPETFCITAAEAMAAGMQVVATKLGALPETTQGFADLIPIDSKDGDALAQIFRDAMRRAIDQFTESPVAWAQERFSQTQRINQTCTWNVRAEQWDSILLE